MVPTDNNVDDGDDIDHNDTENKNSYKSVIVQTRFSKFFTVHYLNGTYCNNKEKSMKLGNSKGTGVNNSKNNNTLLAKST